MPYNKDKAVAELEAKLGWRSYGRKHGESIFTKLFQNYYLPKRFGYDKRRPHLSSLIVSGQLTREEALRKLAEPLYDSRELEVDLAYFCKKLRISRDEFDALLKQPLTHYSEFSNWDARHRMLKRLQGSMERVTGRRMNVYS
jgi:hypothetical protein